MIKVEVYFGSFSLEEGEPDLLLTLKEFEERINKWYDDVRDAYHIKFVVA